jgi:subtilisin family serine protease
MDKTVIAVPLLEMLHKDRQARTLAATAAPQVYDVIIDLNLGFPEGREGARQRIQALLKEILTERGIDLDQQGINQPKSRFSQQYLFARLSADVLEELVYRDSHQQGVGGGAAAAEAPKSPAATRGETLGIPISNRAIYHVWPDFAVERLTTRSVSTVKADAARKSFAAFGEGIVWAVLDSGIDQDHPHFHRHRNLALDPPLRHLDFTTLTGDGNPLEDMFGHGTHLAGIIAGEVEAGVTDWEKTATGETVRAEVSATARIRYRDEGGEIRQDDLKLQTISGMAPKCKLLSLKVLDENGQGQASSLIAALEYIQELNGFGRHLRVHGVNMSVGYTFEPEWFACGQSPLCVEVDRLVRTGVVVVVAAGNTGYGYAQSAFRGPVAAGMELSINDPGNAELAITVGSTHRDMPHVYGVSYFSSKGPTGDGRLKPDLVAPGEKIISCQTSGRRAPAAPPGGPPTTPPAPGIPGIAPAAAAAALGGGVATREAPAAVAAPAGGNGVAPQPASAATLPGAAPAIPVNAAYKEDSGTSMAAPHVSGVIAAFLSIRREYIGQAEAVKEIFLATATDLNRVPAFQGRGLVDLMRAIQSV